MSHIGITLVYTITQAIIYFYKTNTQQYRMESGLFFFGGLADLFLSVILWFILDNHKKLAVLVDGERIYAVTEVIKLSDTSIN